MQDVISVGPDRPRRPTPRWLMAAGVIVAAVVAALVATNLGRSQGGGPAATRPLPSPSTATSPLPCPTASPAAAAPIVAAGLAIADPASATALVRRDAGAGKGPWSVVVRRRDGGSFGRQSAVVTFPVDAPVDAVDSRPVDVGGAPGRLGTNTIVWPVAGGRARVRGDLPDDGLLAIARATTVVGRRPVVRPLDGYTVSAARPYRPAEIHELRYEGAALGAAGAALGFVYTGVLRGAAFEDQILAQTVPVADPVAGHPAYVSRLMGGSATLAWSPAPGVVAYVGYSGGQLDARAIEALGCLARTSRLMSDAEWRATQPVVSDQSNDVG